MGWNDYRLIVRAHLLVSFDCDLAWFPIEGAFRGLSIWLRKVKLRAPKASFGPMQMTPDSTWHVGARLYPLLPPSTFSFPRMPFTKETEAVKIKPVVSKVARFLSRYSQ